MLARRFQYRVEVFFKERVLHGPLGYCVIRVDPSETAEVHNLVQTYHKHTYSTKLLHVGLVSDDFLLIKQLLLTHNLQKYLTLKGKISYRDEKQFSAK